MCFQAQQQQQQLRSLLEIQILRSTQGRLDGNLQRGG